MTSEHVDDWDQPIPSREEVVESNDSQTYEERRHHENIKKLKVYVEQMTYVPIKPPLASAYTENLSKPRRRNVITTAEGYSNVVEPKERGNRLKRLARKYTTITTEELEKTIRANKTDNTQREDTLKRKHELYYEMLDKLERQCRSQYLQVLINKFSNFISKLATTMHIPSNLVDPYARMQRGIFCNILLAIGVQPSSQAAIYYNTREGSEYEECHRLSHAILSLVIKALDAASTRNSDNTEPIEVGFEMDDYIKDRIMCAAEKKVQAIAKSKRQGGENSPNLRAVYEKCSHEHYRPCK